MSEVEEVDYLEAAQGPGVVEIPEDLDLTGADGAEDGAQEQTVLPPGWEQSTIEQFLRGTGAGIHMLAGRAERDWLMTEQDLERIAPPLTRICNRYEATLKLSPIADPLLVAHGFALYGWRSALEAKRAERDAEAELAGGPGYEHGPAPQDVDDAADELGEQLHQPGYFDQGGEQ